MENLEKSWFIFYNLINSLFLGVQLDQTEGKHFSYKIYALNSWFRSGADSDGGSRGPPVSFKNTYHKQITKI